MYKQTTQFRVSLNSYGHIWQIVIAVVSTATASATTTMNDNCVHHPYKKKKSIELQIFRNVAMSRGEYEMQAAHRGRKGFRRVAKASEDSKGGKASEDLS